MPFQVLHYKTHNLVLLLNRLLPVYFLCSYFIKYLLVSSKLGTTLSPIALFLFMPSHSCHFLSVSACESAGSKTISHPLKLSSILKHPHSLICPTHIYYLCIFHNS